MTPFWINTGSPLRLALVLCPRGDDSLEDDIAQCKQAGIDILVSMLEHEEAVSLGLAAEAELCKADGLSFLSFPIPDRQTPPSIASFTNFVEQLRALAHAGRSIAVHCRASIGRSSVLLASLLVMEGFTPDQAFKRLTAARGVQVPDTPDQVRWVEQFAASR